MATIVTSPEGGQYDANYGTVLVNTGNSRFKPVPINSLAIRRQVKLMANVHVNGKTDVIIARNDESLLVRQQSAKAP